MRSMEAGGTLGKGVFYAIRREVIFVGGSNLLLKAIGLLVSECRVEVAALFAGQSQPGTKWEYELLMQHCLALLFFSSNRKSAGLDALTKAVEIEKEAGAKLMVQHTLHQISFMSQPGPCLLEIVGYYRSTLETLNSQGNQGGAALITKSFSDLELVRGHPKRAAAGWAEAAKGFGDKHETERAIVACWAELAETWQPAEKNEPET